jgi:hypothetical protein
MIDHQDAVKSLMAERYLLGELNAGEREAYEEHFFSCDACFYMGKWLLKPVCFILFLNLFFRDLR